MRHIRIPGQIHRLKTAGDMLHVSYFRQRRWWQFWKPKITVETRAVPDASLNTGWAQVEAPNQPH